MSHVVGTHTVLLPESIASGVQWRLLAVASLVVLAGCSSFVGGDQETTVTPAPVPQDDDPPATPDPYPPGLDAGGVTDAGALAEAHVDAVVGTSYVFVEEESGEQQFNNVTAETELGQRIVFENGTHYHRVTDRIFQRLEGDRKFLPGYQRYADGSVQYTRYLGGAGGGEGGVVYEAGPAGNASWKYASFAFDPIQRYLDVGNASVTQITVKGQPHYLIGGSRDRLATYGEVRNYTARAVVARSGFVRWLNVTFEATTNGQEVEFGYRFRYDRVGTATVQPPAWLPEARNVTGADG